MVASDLTVRFAASPLRLIPINGVGAGGAVGQVIPIGSHDILTGVNAPGAVGFVTPFTGTKRANLLNYITQLKNRTTAKVLIGQQWAPTGWPAGSNNTFDHVNGVFALTGKWPAMMGVPAEWFGNTQIVSTAKTWGAAGGILDMGCWWRNPATGGSDSDLNITFHNVLVTGTTERINFYAAVDAAASRLQQIQAAGYVALFRPFIENNGNWFWWGTSKASATDFIALWRELYTYLNVTKGLANMLIWDFNINAGVGSYTTMYPGNAYVDTVSIDYYGDTPGSACLSAYNAVLSTNKPIRIAEFGCHTSDWTIMDQPAQAFTYDNSTLINNIQTTLPNVFAASFWSENWAINEQNGSVALMTHPWAIDRSELPVF